MANVLVGRWAVAARQLASGEAAAFEVRIGQLVQIVDLAGQQIATLLAFNRENPAERLSTAATITANKSIVLGRESSLRSTQRMSMLTLVEDSVGRHDLLTASPAPDTGTATANGTPACQEALAAVAAEQGIGPELLPDPVHWFKNVIIKQRGEIEERDPLSERNDTVVLRAEMDMLVIIANCPPGTRTHRSINGDRRHLLLVRIYGEP